MTKDGSKVDRLIYAGMNLDKALELFQEWIKHQRRITLRRCTRVLKQ